MAYDLLRQDNWSARIFLDGEDIGLWNRDEVKWGSESSEATDPEFGTLPTGGRQTADNVGFNRKFHRIREPQLYAKLKARRGRGLIKVAVHVLDDDGQPTTSQPLDTLEGVLLEATLPPGERGGNDTSDITITVQLKP